MVFGLKERSRHFLATRDPAGVATFWRPATLATPRPCQPWPSLWQCGGPGCGLGRLGAGAKGSAAGEGLEAQGGGGGGGALGPGRSLAPRGRRISCCFFFFLLRSRKGGASEFLHIRRVRAAELRTFAGSERWSCARSPGPSGRGSIPLTPPPTPPPPLGRRLPRRLLARGGLHPADIGASRHSAQAPRHHLLRAAAAAECFSPWPRRRILLSARLSPALAANVARGP